MRIDLLSESDIDGGAARATYRIHCALLKAGHSSTLWVARKLSDDQTVIVPGGDGAHALYPLREFLGRQLGRRFGGIATSARTLGCIPSRWAHRLNHSDGKIVQLHWVGAEMCSIADLRRLRKPVLWRLSDMWPFAGAYHYTADQRWQKGYTRANRPADLKGWDLDQQVWRGKRRHWRKPMHIVAPSSWMAQCVQESALMRNWPVSVIPNAIDTEQWRPIDRRAARDVLGLPQDVPLLLFGAMGAFSDQRKGADLLPAALAWLAHQQPQLQLVIFGESRPSHAVDPPLPTHYLGRLHDDLLLRALYNAADVMLVPSRYDNSPNTAVEALACGTPVVAFRTSGLPDMLNHQKQGYLADPFESVDLARGVAWTLEQGQYLREAARKWSCTRFAEPVIAAQYSQIYEELLAQQLSQGEHK